MRFNQKLYVVTRADLLPGQQAVQGMHALVEFISEHPEKAKEWHSISNYLCFLSVASEFELEALLEAASYKYIVHSSFYEPDLDDALTAIVFEATDQASELVRDCKLALKEPRWHSGCAEASKPSQASSNLALGTESVI